MMKRFLSALLSLAMILSMFTGLTFTASAAGGATYVKVTDASTLQADDVIILVCETKNVAAGAMGSEKYFSSVDATINNGSAESADAIEITLGGEADAWTLTTSEGTIGTSAAKALNHTGSGTTTWTISISDGNAAITSTNSAYGTILYNSSFPRFLNYTSGQTAIQIYKKAVVGECTHENATYVDDPAATCTEAGIRTYTCPDCHATWTSVIPALGHRFENHVCERCHTVEPADVTKVTSLTDGANIVLYNPISNVALSETASGNKLNPVSVTLQNDGATLPATEGVAMLTVQFVEDTDQFHLKKGDLYLTSAPTGNGLSYAAAPAEGETDYGLWSLGTITGGYFTLNNVNAKFNNKVQSLEYYQNLFTTYSTGTGDAFKLYIFSDTVACAHDGETTETVTKAPTCITAGIKTVTCNLCGDVIRTEAIPARGHTFADGLCTVCGAKQPVKMEKTDALVNGEYIALYNPDNGFAVGDLDKGGTLTPVTVAVSDNLMPATDGVAMLKVEFVDETDFRLKLGDDLYLTTNPTGSGLFFAPVPAEGTDYSLWYLDSTTIEGYFMLYSRNADYNGNAQAIEYYGNAFTTYKFNSNNQALYKLELYKPYVLPEPPDEIDIYVIDKTGSQSAPKIWAWDTNQQGFTEGWENRPSMTLKGDAYTEVESAAPSKFNYYQFKLNIATYNKGFLFTADGGQTQDILLADLNLVQLSGGYVVVYLFGNMEVSGCWKNDKEHNIYNDDVDVWTLEEHVEANCQHGSYYKFKGLLKGKTETSAEANDKTDHVWEITYTWAADYSTCKAKAVCSVCETEVSETCSATIKAATETEVTWTASFPNNSEVFADQVHTLPVELPSADESFLKITDAEDLTDGEYLIVYEPTTSTELGLVFDSSLETLDQSRNTKDAYIADGKIAATAANKAIAFTIAKSGDSYTIKAANNQFIGRSENNNGLEAGEDELLNSITFENSVPSITSAGGPKLQFNAAIDQARFRYYKTTQNGIALYKLTDTSHHHHVVHVQAVAPTCLVDGNVEYYYCDVEGCPLAGQYFSDEALTQVLASIVIPAAGHTPAAAVEENRVEPTCTVAGSYDSVVKCSVCGAEISRETVEIPATGHDWGAWTVTTPATCTEAGEESRSCSKCGAVETRALDASGHSYGDYTYDEDHPGHHKRVCSVCGEIELSRCTYVDGVCELCGHEFVVNDITVFAVAPDLNALNAYFWKTENGTDVAKSAWPGEAMTFLGLDTEGRSCFKFTVTNEYENLILNGNGGQYPGSGQGGLEYVFDAGENDYVIYNLSPWTKCDTAEDIYYVPDGTEEYVWAADNSTCTATLHDLATGTAITETVTAIVEHIPAAIGVPGKDVFTADFENELFATQVKEVETEPALHLDDGYYLLIAKDDTQWDINFIDPNNKFEVYSRTAEWKLSTNLTVGDMIKVVKVENGGIVGWYPDGLDNQYHVDANHSGYNTIYFRETRNNDWSEFGGYFYIPGHALNLAIGCTLSLEGATGLNYLINEDALNAQNLTDLKLVVIHTKYDKDNQSYYDETKEAALISTHHEVKGAYYYEFRYENIPFSMLNDHMIARLEGKNSNGETVTTAWKEYNPMSYCYKMGVSGSEKLRPVCANLILYAAEAQKRFGYNTEHLATENWNDALESVANRNVPELTATPSNTPLDGQKLMIKTMTLELEGRVELNLYVVKADEGSQTLEELIEGKKIVFTYENVHGQTSTVEIPSTQWVRSDKDGVERYRCNFSRLNAAEFRKTVTAVIMEGSEQAGNTVTCSVEAYAKIKYSDEVETAMIKAMMNYGDAAAAYFAK